MEKSLNTCVTVSGYLTYELQHQLRRMGDLGYRLVSAQIAKNAYGSDEMFLFFTLDSRINLED